MKKIIESNNFYTFSKFTNNCCELEFFRGFRLSTIIVVEGILELKILNNNKKFFIHKDQAIILTPDVDIEVLNSKFKLFETSSLVNNKPIIEIIDNKGERSEKIINDYKINTKPKKVNKPWGYEIWFSWFKHHHALKKIHMTKGNKCSLQFHRFKFETNFIVKGRAKVLKDIMLKANLNEAEALEEYNKINNFDSYLSNAENGFYWTNVPNEIHRVFSINDYTAYETSTTELDDVTRLIDDNNRISGLILSEHSE